MKEFPITEMDKADARTYHQYRELRYRDMIKGNLYYQYWFAGFHILTLEQIHNRLLLIKLEEDNRILTKKTEICYFLKSDATSYYKSYQFAVQFYLLSIAYKLGCYSI